MLLKFAQSFRFSFSFWDSHPPKQLKSRAQRNIRFENNNKKVIFILIPYILLMQQASLRIVPEFAGQNLNYRSFCQAEKAVGVIVDDSAWKLSSNFGWCNFKTANEPQSGSWQWNCSFTTSVEIKLSCPREVHFSVRVQVFLRKVNYNTPEKLERQNKTTYKITTEKFPNPEKSIRFQPSEPPWLGGLSSWFPRSEG